MRGKVTPVTDHNSGLATSMLLTVTEVVPKFFNFKEPVSKEEAPPGTKILEKLKWLSKRPGSTAPLR